MPRRAGACVFFTKALFPAHLSIWQGFGKRFSRFDKPWQGFGKRFSLLC
jgi:hypothetical protein